MKKIRHMSVSIEGLLRNHLGKKINFMEDDNGKPMTDKQARAEIAILQAKGHKLIPASNKCVGFDPFGGGCPGHEVPEDPRDNPITGDDQWIHDVDMGAK
jgi:hypothetical protein